MNSISMESNNSLLERDELFVKANNERYKITKTKNGTKLNRVFSFNDENEAYSESTLELLKEIFNEKIIRVTTDVDGVVCIKVIKDTKAAVVVIPYFFKALGKADQLKGLTENADSTETNIYKLYMDHYDGKSEDFSIMTKNSMIKILNVEEEGIFVQAIKEFGEIQDEIVSLIKQIYIDMKTFDSLEKADLESTINEPEDLNETFKNEEIESLDMFYEKEDSSVQYRNDNLISIFPYYNQMNNTSIRYDIEDKDNDYNDNYERLDSDAYDFDYSVRSSNSILWVNEIEEEIKSEDYDEMYSHEDMDAFSLLEGYSDLLEIDKENIRIRIESRREHLNLLSMDFKIMNNNDGQDMSEAYFNMYNFVKKSVYEIAKVQKLKTEKMNSEKKSVERKNSLNHEKSLFAQFDHLILQNNKERNMTNQTNTMDALCRESSKDINTNTFEIRNNVNMRSNNKKSASRSFSYNIYNEYTEDRVVMEEADNNTYADNNNNNNNSNMHKCEMLNEYMENNKEYNVDEYISDTSSIYLYNYEDCTDYINNTFNNDSFAMNSEDGTLDSSPFPT